MAPKAVSKKRKAEEVISNHDEDSGSGSDNDNESDSDDDNETGSREGSASDEESTIDERPAKSKSSKSVKPKAKASTTKKSVKEAVKDKGKSTPKSKTKAAASSSKKDAAGSAKKAGAKTPNTPRKRTKLNPKDDISLTALPQDAGIVIPIDVKVEGESIESTQVEKVGPFKQILRLSAPGQFGIVKTIVFQEGEYKNYQAIILRPAVPFNFQGLPDKVRERVYEHLFANNDEIRDHIKVDSKRSKNSNKMFAKVYSNKDPNRVAILAVNKKIHEEASKVLYSHTISFDTASTLMEFLMEVSADTHRMLQDIHIQTLNKPSGRVALSLLSSAVNLQRLTIDKGLLNDQDSVKVAKSFLLDASKFLESHSIANREATAKGVDILRFGETALVNKDNTKWTQSNKDKFLAELRSRLNKLLATIAQVQAAEDYWERLRSNDEYLSPTHRQLWLCICGSNVPGHHCAHEFGKVGVERFRTDKQE